MKIEDYGLIGDLQTAALVGRNGSVDWLCMPRFDSGSCFAALLGDDSHGHWRIAPSGDVVSVARRYRPGTLILETDFETAEGAVRLIDFMPRRGDGMPQLIRIVRGLRGKVGMRLSLALRPDYSAIVPWLEPAPGGMAAAAGPDAFLLSTPVPLDAEDGTVLAEFSALEGAEERFTLGWHPSHEPAGPVEDPNSALARTEASWREWSDRCAYQGPYREAVLTSLIALKAMTHEVTGALVAAPTTSLPEDLGGGRNWDYRYCWLRDTALALTALLINGYTEEARAFRDYVFRATTGDPAEAQIMYGIAGERRLSEFEVPELPGYEGSRPVRVGNAASEQFQLDVYGELATAAYIGQLAIGALGASEQPGLPEQLADAEVDWPRWQALVGHVETVWREPDEGIWEVRGPRRHFTHSKVMAWVVFDRVLRSGEHFGLDGPLERWTATRDEIHAEVCEKGYDPERNTFTQYYGSQELDASLLVIPLVDFLPPDDDRVTGTIDAIQRELGRDGLLSRYSTSHTDDGLEGDEGQFLACSFWLVGALALAGRLDEARALYDQLLSLRNDLGLLSEEYDVKHRRQVGNFPQAFSHLALINAAAILTLAEQGGSMSELLEFSPR